MPTDEPRQDVETFGKKMSKMDRRISGKGYNTIDLSTLVSISFIDYNVLAFQLKSACLHDMVDINPKALEEVATALRLVASEASCVATVAADVSERDAAERVIRAAERPWAGLQ